MTNAEIRSIALATLKSIAPEIDEADLHPDRPLRNQVDLDSMDWLNFLLGLHEKLKVEIPEADYAKLVSLDDVVTYLAARLQSGSGPATR
jgi:acyl carrier protein